MSIRIQEWIDKYNPFNSLKVLAHVEYWKPIKDGIIPPPIFVSIDPSGNCNYRCPHCNADDSLSKTANHKLSISDIDQILDILRDWKTRTVCIGGGGESLMNPNTGYLIDLLVHAKIRIGVVTNGYLIDRFLPNLGLCKWVGVSMDAATPATYAKVKGMSESTMDHVLGNMRKLINGRTVKNNPEVTYKYLIHPNNYNEIYDAAKIAKDIGCDLVHFRPGADPWFDIGRGEFNFTEKMVEEGKEQIERARADFEDKDFKVYGIMHKFGMNWNIKKSFHHCYAGYVTGFISSQGIFGLCCDRRGDPKVELCHISDVKNSWGGRRHLEIMNEIDVSKCPRCTYSHVNEVFENVILEDRMMYDFI